MTAKKVVELGNENNSDLLKGKFILSFFFELFAVDKLKKNQKQIKKNGTYSLENSEAI
jgi:hypothetical protein